VEEVKDKIQDTIQPSVTDRAKDTYKDTMPEALGGRPSMTEHVKDKVEEVKDKVKDKVEGIEGITQPSLLVRAKDAYKDTMPEALGGRPTVGDKVGDKVEEIRDEATHSTQPSTQPSILERVKHTITETIPEMLGVKPSITTNNNVLEDIHSSNEVRAIPDNVVELEVKEVQRAQSKVNEDVQKLHIQPIPYIQKVEYVQRVEIPVTDIENLESIEIRPVTDNTQSDKY